MSNILGTKLKLLREEKKIPQRRLAALLEIDNATYCKIEGGRRKAKKNQVIALADLLEADSQELLQLWSADKIYESLAKENDAIQILNIVAERIVQYSNKTT